jgi:hypothetical protein
MYSTPISRWVVYHFHDTSFSAGVRRPHALNNNIALGPNAENLAPFPLSDQSAPATRSTSGSVTSLGWQRPSLMISSSAQCREARA